MGKFLYIIILLVCFSLLYSCGEKQTIETEKFVTVEKQQPVSTTETGIIEFEILRRWSTSGGIGMEILVSQTAKKEDVLKLARHLRKNHLGRFINISIFNLREAWQHRDDASYPSEKYFKHFLAQINVNPNTGYDEVSWVGK